MNNTGDKPLTMYIIIEPVPKGFEPRKDMLVRDESDIPFARSNGHWCQIPRMMFSKNDGLAVINGLSSILLSPMTFGHPHSHGEGIEEIYFAVEGDIHLLLGKQLRKLPPGSAYKIPPDGNTPHSNINLSDDLIKVVWFMKSNR